MSDILESQDEDFDYNLLLYSINEDDFEVIKQEKQQQSFAYDSVLGRVSKIKLFTVFFPNNIKITCH